MKYSFPLVLHHLNVFLPANIFYKLINIQFASAMQTYAKIAENH